MAVQVILEAVIVLVGACGMIWHSGWIRGEVRRDFFRYYTNLSNLLVVMFYIFRLKRLIGLVNILVKRGLVLN